MIAPIFCEESARHPSRCDTSAAVRSDLASLSTSPDFAATSSASIDASIALPETEIKGLALHSTAGEVFKTF